MPKRGISDAFSAAYKYHYYRFRASENALDTLLDHFLPGVDLLGIAVAITRNSRRQDWAHVLLYTAHAHSSNFIQNLFPMPAGTYYEGITFGAAKQNWRAIVSGQARGRVMEELYDGVLHYNERSGLYIAGFSQATPAA
jgi:hypothetical protein